MVDDVIISVWSVGSDILESGHIQDASEKVVRMNTLKMVLFVLQMVVSDGQVLRVQHGLKSIGSKKFLFFDGP